MQRFLMWSSTAVLSLIIAGAAAAVPINFQLDSITSVGGSAPVGFAYTPDFPILGSGDIDFGAGTGTLSLVDYTFTIDLFNDGNVESLVEITGWTQTITSIDGAGNITSTGGGSADCTNLFGLGSIVCAGVFPTIDGWPAADGATLLSSAVLDEVAQTITVIDNSRPDAGTVTSLYSYSVIPEPGTALLIGGGLMALSANRRRRS